MTYLQHLNDVSEALHEARLTAPTMADFNALGNLMNSLENLISEQEAIERRAKEEGL